MAYDTIHNIAAKTQSHFIRQPSGALIAQKKTSYDWNEYRYDGVQPHAPTHIGERSFTYDLNGNQTGWTHDRNGTRRTITWDEENRIQLVADNGHTMTYKYDHAGERVIKQGPQGETVYVNQFFTIRNREAGTKHIFTGASRAVSKLVTQDKPGANPQGKQPREKDLYFYHPDHLGSTAYVTDTEGKLYQHLQYFPFGETWVEQATNTQRTPYRFAGKELDEETGLYYFGARYFDARTSVWQSADPILNSYLNGQPNNGVFGPRNLSLYAYSYHSPLVLRDPDGRNPGIVYTGYYQAIPAVNIEANLFDDDTFAGSAGNFVVDTLALGVVNQIANVPVSAGNLLGDPLIAVGDALAPYGPTIDGLVMSCPVPCVVPGVVAKGLIGIAKLSTGMARGVDRAIEVQRVLSPRTQRSVTTAVTETAEGVRVVSSSERRLRSAQRAQLRPGEVEGVGPGHAEPTGVNAAREMGLTPVETSASRPICTDCADFLQQQGVQPGSPLK